MASDDGVKCEWSRPVEWSPVAVALFMILSLVLVRLPRARESAGREGLIYRLMASGQMHWAIR